ncbi:MAG: phosphate acyltransferase PlsX [Alphaproteobacteria bacterium]
MGPDSPEITLSIDGMGGDDAPAIVIDGLAIARVRHPHVRYVVHGDEAAIAPLLENHPDLTTHVQISHTDEAISMDDKPSQAVRRGRKTSMWRAIDSIRQGDAVAAVSAGNTGALMAMSKIQLKTLEGIDRPAIASLWPTEVGESVVLDLGANVEADAKQLVDFAVMGATFSRIMTGLKAPKVGLLNIGTEELKGHDEIKAAAQMLRDLPLSMNFIGFVEGDGISAGHADVVVTDGFTGNIALKTAEGTAKLIMAYLKAALGRSLLSKLGALLAAGAFKILKAKLDPRAHNGGVFLGLNGIVVKSHGGTDALGFAAAVDVAVDMAEADLINQIIKEEQVVATVGEGEMTDGGAQSDSGAADKTAPAAQ